MEGFNSRRVAFIAAAMLWLPAGIAASGVIRGFALPNDPNSWFSLLPAAPAGLPLAIGCWLIYRQNMPVFAWTAFAILAPISTFVALPAGLLGPLGIIFAASFLSIPAYVVFAIALRKKKSGLLNSLPG